MFEKTEPEFSVEINVQSGGKTITVRTYYDEGTRWPVIMKDFAAVLEYMTYRGVVDKIDELDQKMLDTTPGVSPFGESDETRRNP
ncbi:hypothetical protein [Microcystis sp. M42BS1]|uniref:hypothetical protein n=1 Tax=Microcystis sp. M42BS1 TaxID=2771192 RepID=UPI00258C7873|nr:hypothetical protein [Microcystis sp. M42BS1]MCA2570657.1 hypothetical protein [Microcystis sp. M42BS1]